MCVCAGRVRSRESALGLYTHRFGIVIERHLTGSLASLVVVDVARVKEEPQRRSLDARLSLALCAKSASVSRQTRIQSAPHATYNIGLCVRYIGNKRRLFVASGDLVMHTFVHMFTATKTAKQ